MTFRLGIIGCGRWGINHVRTADALFGANLVAVADPNPAAAAKVKEISGRIRFSSNVKSIVEGDAVNSVIVATPAETHFQLAKELLRNGKNVLVEKPITLHGEEARELIAVAEEKKLKLMVGHLLLYHPAVLKIKEMLNAGTIGRLQYIYSNRLNFGTVRTEENILWSFAPHDISVIQFLTGSNPVGVTALGAAFLQDKIEDSTVTYLSYPGNVHAHIFVSWLHPFKEHRMVVIGDKGMLVFEDSAQKDKLRLYPKGFSTANGKIEKFDGAFHAIEYEEKQPLAEEQLHFSRTVEENIQPVTGGRHALEVLEILEMAERSLSRNGSRIEHQEILH